MKLLQNLREAIIIAQNRGKKQAEIADFLGISQGAVSKTIKRFEETGSNRAKGMIKRKKAWDEITLKTLIKIVDNFPKRLKACIDANGGWFE
uniref:Uncharacterized protein n=1 Tax=Acrobeloides nanus TaxID=290746 RepID=A0A914CUL2_9BILA